MVGALRFTSADQIAFARLSGDFNPIHLDPVASRNVVAGEPIVHGMHMLLRVLDEHCRRARAEAPLVVSARFHRPALVGETITLNEDHRTLVLTVDGVLPLIELSFGTGAPHVTEPVWPRGAGRRQSPVGRTPRVRTLAELDGAAGVLPIANVAAVRRMFPHVGRALGGDAVAAMAAISRLVGMECPGRDSLLAGLTLHVTPRARAKHLRWRVSRTDGRFGLVQIAFTSEVVSGTVQAFLRPPPAPAPLIETVAAHVAPDEFSGQRALIIGGSRGLGATVALIVASGGGAPLITFASGGAEALRLRHDAARFGRHIGTIRFDAVGDPHVRLARACARFKPTHMYYFATPRIFARRREPFDEALFQRFSAFYVSSFARVCATVRRASSTIEVFYPSTTALDEDPSHDLIEYAAAKSAGEALCHTLNRSAQGLHITVCRLPRVATDQTATIVPIAALEPLAALLPVVRDMHRRSIQRER